MTVLQTIKQGSWQGDGSALLHQKEKLLYLRNRGRAAELEWWTFV